MPNRPSVDILATSPEISARNLADGKNRIADSRSLSGSSNATWLALIVAVCVLLRWWQADGQSLTFDEYYEIQLAQEPVSRILIKGDGFPPLYGVLLKSWGGLLNPWQQFGVESARAFSIVIGTLGCLAIYQLGHLVGGRGTARWAAAILAVLPIHVFYSSEARAYPLLCLITTLALICIIRAIKTNQRRYWIGFAVLATAGLHTHYLFAVFVAITLMISFLQMPGQRWSSVFTAVGILTMLIPLVLMWAAGDFALQKSWVYRVPFSAGALIFTFGSFFTGYTLGPSLRDLHGIEPRFALQQILPWAMLIATGVLMVFLSAKRRVPRQRTSVPVLAAVAAAPIAMGILCQFGQTGYQVRYAIWAVIPLVVYLGWLMSQAVSTYSGRLGIACLALAFAAAIGNRQFVDDYRNADLASVSEFLANEELQPILVVSGYMTEPLKYYLDASRDILGIPMTTPFDERTQEMQKMLDQLTSVNSKFWLIYTREFHEDPDGRIMQQLREQAAITFVKQFAGIKLYQAEGKTL